MGIRIPSNPWLAMTPQQQFLTQQGIQPTGLEGLPQGGEMITPSMPTPEQQKALADLQAAQLQSFTDQRNSIGDLEKYAGNVAAQPVQTDLSSLMGLTDAWTGSKLAGSYSKPQTGADKAERWQN